MYFNAMTADWIRESDNYSDVEHFKRVQEVFDWIMGHIFDAASIRRDTEIELYCPDKYSFKLHHLYHNLQATKLSSSKQLYDE